MTKFFVLGLNPEPWAIGTISRGKNYSSISPNDTLLAYQNAVKEELEDEEMLDWEYVELTFYFWRQQTKYLDASDKIRQKNAADSTNLGKGLEDALQGVLFKNDRIVRDVRSVIVAQGADVTPRIVIKANPFSTSKIENELSYELRYGKPPEKEKAKNPWEESGNLF